jgi:hypothetical protein
MRLETLDPNYSNHPSERVVEARAIQSSAVSSVYSMNIGRNISIASQSEQDQIDQLTLLKNFDEKIIRTDGANTSAETNASTLVQNS